MKPASATHAIFLPSVALDLGSATIGMSTLARLSVSACAVALAQPSVTVVPAGPLISAVDSSEVLPASDLPLTLTMTSPAFRPPSLAGEPS